MDYKQLIEKKLGSAESSNYIIHATVDGKTKTFRVRGAASEAEAKKKFEQHHATTPIVKVVKEDVELEEAGAFSYGAKAPRKGSVAYNAMMKRKEQEKKSKPIEPKDQMVGNAKVTKEETELEETHLKKGAKIKDGKEELTVEKPVGKDKYLVKAKEPVEELSKETYAAAIDAINKKLEAGQGKTSKLQGSKGRATRLARTPADKRVPIKPFKATMKPEYQLGDYDEKSHRSYSESVDRLLEMSKDKLRAYKHKAEMSEPENERQYKNRSKGIERAERKLKEETVQEQMAHPFDWKGYIEQRKKGGTSDSTKTFHDVKKTATGTRYTRQTDGEGAAKFPETKDTMEAPKRGRGRPKGSYGSYKARSAETNARAAAKSAASKAANRAKLKEAFDEEFVASLFEDFTDEQDFLDFEDLLQCEEFEQLDELNRSTLINYIRKAASDAKKKPEKADKRHSGFEKATRKLTSGAPKDRLYGESLDDLSEEEFDQLDELSQNTLASYFHKAIADRHSKDLARDSAKRKGDDETADKLGKKVYNRSVGLEKAKDKFLARESEETKTQEVEQQLDESINKYANFLARTKQ